MANEIKISLSVNYAKGNLKTKFNPATINVDQAGTRYTTEVFNVTTAWAGKGISSDIGTEGIAILQFITTGTTERIILRSTTAAGSEWGELKAQEASILRLSSTAGGSQIIARVTAGTHKLSITVFED